MRAGRETLLFVWLLGLFVPCLAWAEPAEIEVRAEVRNISELVDISVERTADFARVYQSPLTDCIYSMNIYGAITVTDVAANETRTTDGGTKNGCRFVDSGRTQSALVNVTCISGTRINYTVKTDTQPSDAVSILPIFDLSTAGGGGFGTGSGNSGGVTCSLLDTFMRVQIGPRLYLRAGNSAPAGVWTGNLVFEANF
jgi:hypothetical protein